MTDAYRRNIGKIRKIFKKYKIILAVQYGSSVKSRSPKDYDLALYSKRPSRDLLIKIQSELQPFFDRPLDLAVLSSRTDPLLAYEIVTGGSVMYQARKHAFETWLVYAWRRYLDTKKFRDLERMYIKKGLKYVTGRD